MKSILVLLGIIAFSGVQSKCLLPNEFGYQCCKNSDLYNKCLVFNEMFALTNNFDTIYNCEQVKMCCGFKMNLEPTFCENSFVHNITNDLTTKIIPMMTSTDTNMLYHRAFDIYPISLTIHFVVIFLISSYLLFLRYNRVRVVSKKESREKQD